MNAWIHIKAAAACLALTSLLTPSASFAQSVTPDCSQNLVYNGDFSVSGGSLDGWNHNTARDNVYWYLVPLATGYSASNACYGILCITPAGTEQNYLSQSIPTLPGMRYKLTFTYDAGLGGASELQVLFGKDVAEDIVNAAQGPNTYTVTVRAHDFTTVLNFLGEQDNAFSFLSNVSVTPEFPRFDLEHHKQR